MNIKRLLIASTIALLCIGAASAQVERGEKMFGVRTGYVSTNESAVAGLTFRYAVSPWVRIVPEVACVFRHHDKDAFIADINAQVPFTFDSKKVDLYPLAGITFNSWSRHFEGPSGDDVTTRSNYFGANVGAGFDLRCTQTLNLGIEARYTFIKHFTSLYLTASISYVF